MYCIYNINIFFTARAQAVARRGLWKIVRRRLLKYGTLHLLDSIVHESELMAVRARVNKQGWRRFVKLKRSRYHVVSKPLLKFSDVLHVPTYRYYVHKCSGRIFIFV